MNLSQNSLPQKESTITRQARHAFFSAILLAIAASINLITTVRVTLAQPGLLSYLDTGILLAFIIVSLYAAIIIRGGKKKRGVWILLIAFMITLAVRNALISDLGIAFALLSASIVPLVGLLSLKPSEFRHALVLGLSASAFYLLFDTLAARFLTPYRQALIAVRPIAVSIAILTGILIIAYLLVIWRQQRYMLFSSKLILVMLFIALAPVLLLSWANALSLRNVLVPRQTKSLLSKANFLAEDIENFIGLTKNLTLEESRFPALSAYLISTEDAQPNDTLKETALKTLRSYRTGETTYIKSYAILNLDGINLLDTETENIGADESETDYFSAPLETGRPYISKIQRPSGSSEYSFYFSAPIRDENEEKIGVLRAKYDLYAIRRYIDAYADIEDTENKEIFAALLTEKQVPESDASVFLILENSKGAYFDLNLKSVTPLNTSLITPLQIARILPVGSTAQLSLDTPGLDEGLRNRKETPVFEAQAFPRKGVDHSTPLDVIAAVDIDEPDLPWDKPNLPWVVIVSQDLQSYNAPYQQQSDINILLAIVIATVATILGYAGSQYLTRPILDIASVANQISEGNLEARVIVSSEDEIGTLGNAFNSMTERLSHLVENLEIRVAERTQELEKTAEQLRAAVEVGKASASFLNLDELLTQATVLISRQFGFYHAGIFLLDPQGEYAVLRAANSEGGKKMLARGHKLKVGKTGIVGYVTATGEARIALDVGKDATYFDNPDMPRTRSEMALPLVAGRRILGALDIQSTESEAFQKSDTITLQVLADQLSIAIQNARLFEQNQKALLNLQRAYGEQSELGWRELIRKSDQIGYRVTEDGSIYDVDETSDKTSATISDDETVLGDNDLVAHIPITVRGQTIGAMRLAKPDNARAWDAQELGLAKVLATELSKAMDGARLFDETRQQADRERVVGEISERMRETMNVETVVKLAADEFYQLLDLEDITINLTTTDGGGGGGGGGAEETA